MRRPTGSRHRFAIPGRSRKFGKQSGGSARRGLTAIKTKYERINLGTRPTRDQLLEKSSLQQSIGDLYMYEGKFLDAASWFEEALETSEKLAEAGRSGPG